MSGLARLRQIGAAALSAATAGFVAPLLPREWATQPPSELLPRNGEPGARVAACGSCRTRTLTEALFPQGDARHMAERLRLAVEATDLGIWDVDLTTGARYWSPEMRRLLGLGPDDEPSEALFAALIHPEDRGWAWERYASTLAGRQDGNYRAEFRIRRACDGAERWVEATGRVLLDAQGRATHAVGTLVDVTERRRAFQAVLESEERYRVLIETSPDAVLAHRDGVIIFANDRAAALFDAVTPAALIGRSVFDLVEPESLPLARQRTTSLATPGARVAAAELTFRRLDNTPFTVEAAAAAVRLDGELVVQVVFRDVSERKRAEEALRARTVELETVMETVPVGVWIAHDPQARRITGNRQAAEMLRLPREANQSKSAPGDERPTHFRVFKDEREMAPEELPVQRAARGEVVRNEELRIVFDDGAFVDELVSATPVRDATGAVTGAVAASMDITERRAMEARIRHAALHDALTGLPNRVLFHDRLAQALARAKRRGERAAVMLLDLDRFKQINDSLGHAAGDTLLRMVAERLRRVARACDTCARLGGDEFALVVESLGESDGAHVIAQRILANLDEPFHIEGQELQVRASVGVALFPDDGDTARRLMRNADVALYRAKAAGRRRVRHYRPEMDQARRADRSLQIGLRRALKEGGLELVYQPVFDLRPKMRRLVKVEALLRWRPPGGYPVPPSSFIPVAEGSGLIHQLGSWVLRTACRQAKAWVDEGRPIKTAVNVSAAQLRQPKFPDLVEEALRGAGLAPGLLELELTEGVFLDPSKDQIQETLRQLATLGVTLAIDDFGTGYSSLAYLQRFPFDEVKLDGVFLSDIDGRHGGSAVAAAVVKLAHSLGKRLTAEGVETEAQLAFLREQGCDAAQGYLLAPPGPPEAVSRLLAA